MSILTNGNLAKYKFLHNGQPLKHAYHNSTVKLWSAGNTVTYHVDENTAYAEEVEEGANCLSPRSFTPAKAGWTFVGWRADTTASGTVYTGLSMDDSPISLYAVFRASVTVTYYNNSTTAGYTTGYRYYNNGNTAAPSFKLLQAARSGWTARGWSISTAGNGGITFNNNTAFTRGSDITLYGMYQQAVALSYNGNGATGGSVAVQTGTRYYNSNGAYVNPSFTLKANAFTRTGYSFVKWALGSTSGTQYAPGASISVTGNTTMYAAWIADAFYADILTYNWNTSDLSGGNEYKSFEVKSDHIEIETKKNPAAGNHGTFTVYGAFNTRGCNKVRIDIRSDNGFETTDGYSNNVINNIRVKNTNSTNYMYFNCDDDSFKIALSVVDATAYFTSKLQLYSIYFYNE